jgi:hypothetical protein
MIPFIYKIFRRTPSPSPVPEKISNINSVHQTKNIAKLSDSEDHPKSENTQKLNSSKISSNESRKDSHPSKDEYTPHPKEEEMNPPSTSKSYDSHFTNHVSLPEHPIPDVVLSETDSKRELASMQFKIDLPNGSFLHCLLHWDQPTQNAWIQISSENMELLGNFSQIKHRFIEDIKKIGFHEVHFEIVYE